MDATNNVYSHISKEITTDNDDCARFCGKLPSPDLVGFQRVTTSGNCQCLYSDQNLPTPPSGLDWQMVVNTLLGIGPIVASTGSPAEYQCYIFTQVREVLTLQSIMASALSLITQHV